MQARTGFMQINNDKRLIRDHAHTVREALFACTTRPQVECAVAFARYLSFCGLNSDNYWLFLRLVMTNNPWVVDELLHERVPQLLFSTIRPECELIDAAFEMLFSRHPEEMYVKALESVLGIIQNAYFDPDDGYRIRKLSIMDINALGKFLIKDESQDHPLNRLVLEILDRIAHLGDYYGEQDKNVLSKHAFNVRYAYFDHTRELVDAIPGPLLVRIADSTGVPPEEDYATLVTSRRQQKRDMYGRFAKASEKEQASEKVPVSENPLPSDKPAMSETPKTVASANAGTAKKTGKTATSAKKKPGTTKPSKK